MAEEDGVQMSVHVSESLMNLGGNLDRVDEIALVSEESFVSFIRCWNTTEALNLCWKLTVISAEKSDLRWLRILEESVNDSVANGTSCSGNQNVETVVVPAEIHIVEMCFVCTSNWTLRLWLILLLNTNSTGYNSTK